MNAIVMSGASNFGAMQAGALEMLFQAGFVPNLAVGTSAGGLNAIWISANTNLNGVHELQSIWRSAGPEQVGVPNPISAIRRLIRREDSVVSSESLHDFLEGVLPAGVFTFGELRTLQSVPAYVTGIEMGSGELVVFGDREDDRLLDGAMATTAIPPYFPPWETPNGRYMDGGARSKLPILLAIERGATSVVGLNVSDSEGRSENAKGVLAVSQYAVALMLKEQTASEIRQARLEGIPTRVFELVPPKDVTFWDYTQPDRLIEVGREQVKRQLELEPLQLEVPVGNRVRNWVRNLVFPQSE